MNKWHKIGLAFPFAVYLGLVLIAPATWASADTKKDGEAVFEKRCSACHQLPDPDNPPPEGWAKRLDKMAPLARLKPDQKSAVLDYLSSHVEQAAKKASLEEDKAFFEKKCSRCHSLERIFLEPLTDESRRHVVSRMQAKSGTDWLSDDDVKRILDYLSRAKIDAPKPADLGDGASPDEIFAARCQACHTLERVFLNLNSENAKKMDWSHVVSRMRNKAPQWMSDKEATEVTDYLKSLSASQSGKPSAKP